MKIFLDLDGTILDIERKCYRLYANILEHGGFSIMDMKTYWKMKRRKTAEEIIASKTVPLTFAKYYVAKRKSMIETMDYLALDTVFDGVYDILDKWGFEHELCLVTLRYNAVNLWRQLVLLDLRKYFNCIYSSDKLKTKKEELIKHEVGDGNCVIIGDAETDIEAGKVLSIKTVGVNSGIRNKHLLKKMSPDILVKNLCDLKLSNQTENCFGSR